MNALRWIRILSYVRRQLTRHRVRTTLTVAGIAVAMFLWSVVRSAERGVREATELTADDTRLVVYRENRFCPFASQLPQRYEHAIAAIPGVRSVMPVKIVVSNCRASLDVMTFRGIPPESLETALLDHATIKEGGAEAWLRRGDAALIGTSLAERRRLKPGDRFVSAGVAVTVAGILESDEPQDRNTAFVHLPFLQEQAKRGGTGTIVTQFSVTVDDHAQLGPVARAIDDTFRTDESPTSTSPEKSFVARAAADVVRLTEFAGMLGLASLVAVFALVANAVVMSMQSRVRETAILETLGFTGGLLGWMTLSEGLALAMTGGLLGAVGAWSWLVWLAPAISADGATVEITPSAEVMVIGLAASAVIGLLAGAVPAFRAARREVAQGFRTT